MLNIFSNHQGFSPEAWISAPETGPLEAGERGREKSGNEQFLFERSGTERVKLLADFSRVSERTPSGAASRGAFSLVLSFGTKRKYI